MNADHHVEALRHLVDRREARVAEEVIAVGGQHRARTIAVGPDNLLYMGVGSTCNACDETNPENATLLRANLDGSHRWTQWLGYLAEDLETAVRPHLALAPEGEAWVYGGFWGTKQFGTFTLTATQGTDNVLLRLAP